LNFLSIFLVLKFKANFRTVRIVSARRDAKKGKKKL